VFTRSRHWSVLPYFFNINFNTIIPPRLGPTSGLNLSDFPTKILYTFLMRATCPAHFISLLLLTFLLTLHLRLSQFPFQFRIREIPGLSLGQEAGYLQGLPALSLIFRVPPGKCKDTTLKQATAASFHILSNSPICHPTIRRHNPRSSQSAVK
jgi:hypothetical protein